MFRSCSRNHSLWPCVFVPDDPSQTRELVVASDDALARLTPRSTAKRLNLHKGSVWQTGYCPDNILEIRESAVPFSHAWQKVLSSYRVDPTRLNDQGWSELVELTYCE
jgi:hypothetical protein